MVSTPFMWSNVVTVLLDYINWYMCAALGQLKFYLWTCLDFSPDSAVIATRQAELENAYRETAALSDERRDKLQVCILYLAVVYILLSLL